VGARRWPFVGSHPGCWREPWKGEVLRMDDRRAWEGASGYEGRPSAGQMVSLLERTQDLRRGLVPVLWNFENPRIYWERVECLKGYEEDLREWREARARAEQVEVERGCVTWGER